ncbi:MAG: hypothetical protein P8R54_28130 [Myxococcota bacterium]|nr:hypothetical protein [Myxococcota bacterium]
MIALMLLAGCGGCVHEPLLLPVADCSDDSWNAHHTFYDKRTFAWSLSCPDEPEQSGMFRVGAVLKTDTLPELTSGVPCSKTVHGECPVLKPGMGSGVLIRDGARPASVSYRYRCGDDAAALALWFTTAQGEIRCDDSGACFAADAEAAPASCALTLSVTEPG